jgi:hypothetical protein
VIYNDAMLFGFFTFEKNLKYGFQIFSILKKKKKTHAPTNQPTNQPIIIIDFSNYKKKYKFFLLI